MTKNVLITGMSGLIGGLLKDHLLESGGYELTALNRRAVEGVRTVQADIADLDAIRPAFEGQDVVVHLAAYLGAQDWEGQHAGNVLGTFNVFEAAAAGWGVAGDIRVQRQRDSGVRAGAAVLAYRQRGVRQSS